MEKIKTLLIGTGGRESAFLYKILQSPLLEKCFFCGIPQFFTHEKLEIVNLDAADNAKIVEFCKKNAIDFVIPCPEAPLCNGIVDALSEAGIESFGPNKLASQLEGSKIFMKDVLQKAGVPTAKYRTFTSEEFTQACEFIREFVGKIVIKTDGLAAGKGVYICENQSDAQQVVEEFFQGKFGNAGKKIVIEEFFEGPEVSVFAFCDGKNAIPFFHACDYKKVFDGDLGLNTGGMGSFAPSFLSENDFKSIVKTHFNATLAELQNRGISFTGVLFGGLIITKDGAKFLEYNVRMGDPETQSILPLLKSDLLEILLKSSRGQLVDGDIEFENRACVTVVLTSGGYPLDFEKNKEITGFSDISCLAFPAGLQQNNGKFVTSGGRVLCISAVENSILEARETVYQNVAKISFEGVHFRTDIANFDSTNGN